MVFNSSYFRSVLLIAIAILACQWWVEAVSCHAQPPPENPATKGKQSPVAPSNEILKEGTLQLDADLYLPDSSNEPRFVPNFPLGGFLEILRQRNSHDEFPQFSFEQVSVLGTVAGNILNLTGSFRVSVTEKPAEALAIPLRFESCQLTTRPQFDGGGSQQLVLNTDGPGYRWWLKVDIPGEFTAKLTGQSVVTQDGDRKRVKISLPLAPCQIELQLPKDAVDPTVSGQGNEVLQTDASGSGARITIRGNGGELAVSWRSKQTDLRVAAIEAKSWTRFEIDDPRSTWEANSKVSVRWYGEEVSDEVTLLLPPGSHWLPSPFSSDLYSIAPKTARADIADDSPIELVIRFRTDEPQLTNSLDIPVRFEWQPPQLDRSINIEPFAMPGISLQSVDKHEGTIEYVMPNSFSLQWRVGAGSELVQQSRLNDGLERSQYVFRFDRQPLDITGSLRRESSLAGLRPTYLAEVDRDKIKLTAWLECSFDLAQRPILGVLLGDWILDSAELIPSLAQAQTPGEALKRETQADGSITLSYSEPADGTIGARRTQQVWRLVAFRSWTADDGNALNLQIPQYVRIRGDGLEPDVDHGSGVLLVAGGDNLRLRWNESASSGLLSDSLSVQLAELLTPELTNHATIYRFQSGAQVAPTWSGSAEFIPRQISYEQRAEFAVDARTVEITQGFALQIANEPLELLRISVSPRVNNVFAKVNDEIVALRLLPGAETAGDDASSWLRYEIVGATSLRKKVAVTVQTQVILPSPEVARDAVYTAIPLAKLELPDDARPTIQQLIVSGSRDVEVLSGEADDQAIAGVRSQLSLFGQPQNLAPDQREILLQIRQVDRLSESPVRISRAWLQTALSGTDRRDRFCARLQTSQSKLTLQLPATQGPPPQIFVDGQSVLLDTISADRYQFELPKKIDDDQYTLDVWTWPVGSLAWISPVDISIPRIEGTQVVDRFYWQLVVPPNHQLALIPPQFICEWKWIWNGLWWNRRSVLNQIELEQWVGVAPQTQLAAGANRYLLSSFGKSTDFQGWVVSRLALWLPVGLLAILATVILSSVRMLRHPSLLMFLALLLGSGAMVWPDLAILLGQTILLSLGLVMLTLAVRSAIDMRVRRRSVFTSRPSTQVDRSELFSEGGPVQVKSATTQTHLPVTADSGVR